jgi:hypothetical protein
VKVGGGVVLVAIFTEGTHLDFDVRTKNFYQFGDVYACSPVDEWRIFLRNQINSHSAMLVAENF